MPEQLSYHSIEGYRSVMCLLKVPPNLPPGPAGSYSEDWGKEFVDWATNVEGETSPRKALDHKNP
jgi:hypothetical protein